MAAAAVFAGDAAAPADSRNVATAVNQFVAHVPAPGRGAGCRGAPACGRRPRARRGTRAGGRAGGRPGAGGRACSGGCTRPAPEAAPAPAPAPCPHPLRRLPRHPIPARRRRGRCARVRSGRPADAGLHVPVDQQRVPEGRRQCAGDRDLGGGPGEDPGTRTRRRARRPTCSPRSARPPRRPSRSCR